MRHTEGSACDRPDNCWRELSGEAHRRHPTIMPFNIAITARAERNGFRLADAGRYQQGETARSRGARPLTVNEVKPRPSVRQGVAMA